MTIPPLLFYRNLIFFADSGKFNCQNRIIFLRMCQEQQKTTRHILSHIILYFADRKEAEKINADLARFQEKQMTRKSGKDEAPHPDGAGAAR